MNNLISNNEKLFQIGHVTISKNSYTHVLCQNFKMMNDMARNNK